MKISILPTTAIAFTVLSILAVLLNRVGLTHLETVWPAMTAYSAVIAAAAWLDRRSAQRVGAPHPLDSNDTAAALAVQGYDLTNVVAFAPRNSGTVHQEQQQPASRAA